MSSSAIFQQRQGLGWTKYAWLAYLAFYFAPLVMGPTTTRQWQIGRASCRERV